MSERNQNRIDKIKKHLTDKVVQERLRQNIQRGRSEVMVTIGQAARVFGFSESQLRDWEKSGLLKPVRSKEGNSSNATTKQRQYSFVELDKLAIIQELITHANLTPGLIPSDIDQLWYSIAPSTPESSRQWNGSAEKLLDVAEMPRQDPYQYIIRRLETAYRSDLGWRHYASRALLLALMLLYEDIPNTYAGLILPTYANYSGTPTSDPSDLSALGDSLVGWLGLTRSFYTFLTPQPAFEFPSDYRILPLADMLRGGTDSVAARTLLVVQRDKAADLQFDERAVQVALRLLAPLYEDRQDWYSYFGDGVRDLVYPGMDFTPKVSDAVLNSLAEMVVRLGGKKGNGEARWRFCCIYLPDTQRLPLQQRGLLLRAKSSEAHEHVIGVTNVSPDRYGTSLSLRAYQGGHIIYRPELAREDVTVGFENLEGPILSNIAVPIGGETELPLGALYVASYDIDSFSEEDQRVLRVMARIVEELLRAYTARRQVTRELVDLIRDPVTVDSSFKEFLSENDFMRYLELILTDIQRQVQRKPEHSRQSGESGEETQQISFVAIELDNQERISNTYGDQTLKNLHRAIGLRIRGLFPTLFSSYENYEMYYMCAGRFYLLLRGSSLERARSKAEGFRKALGGGVQVKQSDLPGGSLIIPKVSVHLAVTWYSPAKLKEFFDPERRRSVADVSSTLYHSLDFGLKSGVDEGGNVVISWDQATRMYVPYTEDGEKN